MAARKAKKKSSKRTRDGKEELLRVGVIGALRGMSFARQAEHTGMKLVAICDTWKKSLKKAKTQFPDIKTYTDYTKFLSHDMDAVILANYAHQHAPFAIQALDAGLHVMSEVIACSTLAEGVALAEAVERSSKIYMMAENYCFFTYNQEMRRLYRDGEIGEVQFAECEYNHTEAAVTLNHLGPGLDHWRNWLPSTYYPTHALGPIMYITDERPVSVNALSIARSDADEENMIVQRGDPGSCILLRMGNGAVVHVFGLKLRGHSIWYRLHGTRGQMENMRTEGEKHKLRVFHDRWDKKGDDVDEKIYTPEFPVHADKAKAAGHGGGDFFTNLFFADAIRTGKQPWLNVYRSLDMSLVAIQAWRSCLQDGTPFELPDLRRKSVRKKYADDHWSPFPEDADKQPNQPPPSITGTNAPTKKQIAAAKKDWAEMDYHGK